MSPHSQSPSEGTYQTSRVFFSTWIIIPWLLLVIFGALALLPVVFDDEGNTLERVIVLGALLFAATITGSHHGLKITKDTLTVTSFPLFHKKIPLSSIASVCEGREINAFKDYGFGPKISNGAWIIGNRSGKSFEIRLHDGKRYVIVVPDERELSEVLALTDRKICAVAKSDFS